MGDRSWLDSIPRFPGWILGVVSFVTTLVGFIELWRRGPALMNAVLLAIGVVAGGLGCAYLAFKRAPPLLAAKGPWQFPRARPWALASLGSLFVAASGVLGYFVYQQHRPVGIIILVADFDGEHPKKYRVTEHIIRKLRAAMEPYRDDVKVQSLGEVITTTQGGSDLARAKGAERRASIVLWGEYAVTATNVRVTANFELLRKPKAFSPNQPAQTLTVTPTALDGFKVQDDLAGQMSHITLLSVGAAHLDAQDYDKAIAFFADALNLPAPEGMVDPGDIHALSGVAHFAKGDSDRALVEMDRALQHGGDRIGFLVTRGTIYLSKFDPDAGVKDFNQAIDSALLIPHRDAKTNSKLATAYWGRGQSYLIKGDKTSAQEDFRRVIPLVTTDSPGAYLIRGMAHEHTGDLERAIADFSRSIELDSQDRCACAYLLRAQAYLTKGDPKRGLADLDRASRYAPNSPMLHLTRGMFLAEQSDHVAAIADLSKAIQLSPHLGIAYAVRGLSYKQSDDATNALADFTRAISLMPNYAAGYLTRGQFYRERKDYDRAIPDFTQAVTLDPSLGLAYVERAYAYLEQKQYDLAMADSTRAIQLRPPRHLSAGHVMRGRAHLGKGALDAAIADFSQAIELQPSVSAYSFRALAYKQKSDKQRAISDLNDARQYSKEGSSQRQWVEEELKRVQAMAD